MSDSVNTTFIIVTYNSASTIELILDAIDAQTVSSLQYKVIVVDNDSHDNTCQLIHQGYPHVKLVELTENIGFGRANNVALQLVTTQFVALVNPDCQLHPNWLQAMLGFMNEQPDVAIAGSKLFYRNQQVIQHVGGVITANALTRHVGEYELDIGQYNQVLDFPYVTAAAIFCRFEPMLAVDFFDERYFMYYDETDLCLRLIRNGYRIALCPDATAIHFEDKSLGQQQSKQYLFLYHHSRLKFVTRHANSTLFLNEFLPAELLWLRHSIQGMHRLMVIYIYILCLPDIIRTLFNREVKIFWMRLYTEICDTDIK